ncbi:MAG: leucine-rich repeat domain-containing protein, partial [Firmicutes bacterium]|nr:leucine-rich repeat domain-containing protein [Bacillota bacterium]
MKKWIDWLSRHTFITTCTIALLLCVLVTIGYGAYNKIAYVRLLSQPITSKSGQHQSCITVAKFTNLAFETALRKAINRTEGILFREELEMVNDLAMVDSAELDDITDIAMLPNLENLAIINCSVQDITPLASLDKLVNVHLCQNKIEDITPLSRLQFVEVLDLSSNQISTLPPDMNGLKNLNLLVLDDNGLENLDHIEEIPVLEKLQVRHNHIEKLKILGPIPNLASLDVSNNPI